MNNPSSFSTVARDVIDLCELQIQLLSIDSQAAKRKLTRAGVFAATAATLAGSALTVLMMGTGILLAEFTRLSTGGGLLLVGVLMFVLVTLLVVASLFAVQAAAAAMSETKSEFAENLRWLKAMLVAPQTSHRNQIRRETFNGRGVGDPNLANPAAH